MTNVTSWWHSPQCVIGLFPEWYAPRQSDWPPQVHLTSFPLWEADNDQPLPDAVQRFLDAGDPPIVFTPGSANVFGADFFAEAVAACQTLKRRGMLMTRYPDQVPTNLPPNVQHFAYAPFFKLLPKVAAISHHGGIGTAASALAAGIPQLIMPLSHDQPDNAARLARLNVGDWLPPPQYRAPAVAEKLQTLLTDNSVAAACDSYASKLADQRPFDATCEILESLVGTDGSK